MSDSPGEGNSAAIDRAALAVISGGDQSVERRMLAVFRKSNATDAAALRQAIEKQDIAAVTRLSHRVMGAGRIVGATTLAGICKKISQAGLDGDWNAIAANRDALYREIDRVNAYLNALPV